MLGLEEKRSSKLTSCSGFFKEAGTPIVTD